jgi:hypothetical protein
MLLMVPGYGRRAVGEHEPEFLVQEPQVQDDVVDRQNQDRGREHLGDQERRERGAIAGEAAVVVFLIAQRYLISGLTCGGVKG